MFTTRNVFRLFWAHRQIMDFSLWFVRKIHVAKRLQIAIYASVFPTSFISNTRKFLSTKRWRLIKNTVGVLRQIVPTLSFSQTTGQFNPPRQDLIHLQRSTLSTHLSSNALFARSITAWPVVLTSTRVSLVNSTSVITWCQKTTKSSLSSPKVPSSKSAPSAASGFRDHKAVTTWHAGVANTSATNVATNTAWTVLAID